jgi:hypothetical protein
MFHFFILVVNVFACSPAIVSLDLVLAEEVKQRVKNSWQYEWVQMFLWLPISYHNMWPFDACIISASYPHCIFVK